MRTLEYLALTAVVALGVWFMATALSTSISAAFEQSAARIERAGK